MLEALREDEADIVVGSRYLAEGGLGDWSKGRRTISKAATQLSRLVLRGRELTDPMSGFFMLKRSAFDAGVRRLSQEGYKILLDIVASSPGLAAHQGAALRVRRCASTARASSTAWWCSTT